MQIFDKGNHRSFFLKLAFLFCFYFYFSNMAIANDAAILFAFQEDISDVGSIIPLPRQTTRMAGRDFYSTSLQGGRFLLGVSKAGSVETAITCDAALVGQRAQRIISIGVAGALNENFKPGDIVVIKKVSCHDRGSWLRGKFQPRVDEATDVVWDDFMIQFDQQLRMILGGTRASASVKDATLVSGNSFIADSAKRRELSEQFHADLVDMNSAAMTECAGAMNRPVYILRVVSDYANESATEDFRKFIENRNETLRPVMEAVAKVLMGMRK